MKEKSFRDRVSGFPWILGASV